MLDNLITRRSLILKTKKQIGALAAQDKEVEAIESLTRPVSAQEKGEEQDINNRIQVQGALLPR